MTYSIDYFIEKFDAIPDENWFTKSFFNIFNSAQKCALGHCNIVTDVNSKEVENIRDIFNGTLNVVKINDGDSIYKELGDTPKERILNALLLVKCGLWKEAVG